MTPLGVFARTTPGHRSSQVASLVPEQRPTASPAIAAALAALVALLQSAPAGEQQGREPALPADGTPEWGVRELSRDVQSTQGQTTQGQTTQGQSTQVQSTQVQSALRELTARTREGALMLRIVQGQLLLDGEAVSDKMSAMRTPFAHLTPLMALLIERGIGSITIREGAVPGELQTLAVFLAQGAATDVPTTTPVDTGARELLRTWSIIVAPARTTGPEPLVQPDLSTPPSVGALASRMQSRYDGIVDAEARGDAIALERTAAFAVAQLRAVGSGGGRVATESIIRRLLHPKALLLLASRLPHTSDSASLLHVLSRAGDASVAALLQHLLEADDATQRRAYFDAIVAMDVGAALLLSALDDPRWFVVRNAAALLGEMQVEHADSALLGLLAHTDGRIRTAAARALSRIRTSLALTGLQTLIGEPNPELRRLAAMAYGLAGTMPDRARPPAGPLADALDRETDEDVALEMVSALGRLANSHAVQRLLRAADPSNPSVVLRVAALTALVQARGHAMLTLVESMLTDPEPDIVLAAARLQPIAARRA